MKRRWAWALGFLVVLALALTLASLLRHQSSDYAFLRRCKYIGSFPGTPGWTNRTYETSVPYYEIHAEAEVELKRDGYVLLSDEPNLAIFFRKETPQSDEQISEITFRHPSESAITKTPVLVEFDEGEREAVTPWRKFVKRWLPWFY